MELFFEKGYTDVGVQEIAETAGITKPTLYYYYGSKYGLLTSLLEIKGTELINKLREAVDGKEGLPPTLYKIASIYLTDDNTNKIFYLFMISLYYSSKNNETYKAVKPYIKEQYEIFVKVFADASNYLGNMRGRQEQFAIGFMGIINTYMLVHYEKDKNSQITGDIIFSLVHQFMHGIYS